MSINHNDELTEAAFRNQDYARFIDYAINVVYGFAHRLNLCSDNQESFIMDAVFRGLEYAREDFEKGLYNKMKPFKNFFWYRIKKAFYETLSEQYPDANKISFAEGLGKYYDNPDGHDEMQEYYDDKDEHINIDGRSSYCASCEKEQILEDNRKEKLEFVRKIKNIVSMMDPMDIRLFNIRFGFDLTEEDQSTISALRKVSHAKEYYVKMAANEFGIKEDAVRKRIYDMIHYLQKALAKSGDMEAYKNRTSLPGLLEYIVVNPKNALEELNLDKFSSEDCFDIWTELMF